MLPALEQKFGTATSLEENERELQRLLRARGIYFGDNVLPTYAYAFLAPEERILHWAKQAERLIDAAERAANLLVTDSSFFDAMGLGKSARELVAVDPGYRRICVLCRPDGIPLGSDVKFVEVNSDSPAMMMFIDVVADCLLELDAFAWLRPKRPASAADRLFDTLLDCYREQRGNSMPNIAIADWEGQKTRFEHQRLAEHFEKRGAATVVSDPRAFRRANGALWLGDRRIDLVYRRALSSELIERAAEIGPLLDSYRDGSVCMVNPLRSYVAGVKSVLSYLAVNGAGDVVPRTMLLDSDEKRDLVRSTSSKWVLKKSESHGGENVVLPSPENHDEWHAALAASSRDVWIAQEYLEIPKLALPVVENGRMVEVEKHYNWNPFMFGGRYAGGLVRVSSTPLINITLGGGLLPTFYK